VVSTADALIPSAEEGPRLKKAMPRCTVETLEGASHAALQEAGIDLPAILRRNGFLPRQPSDPPSLTRDAAFTPPSPAEVGLSLTPGGCQIGSHGPYWLSSIEPCFDCKITRKVLPGCQIGYVWTILAVN
jgi:hypothetical protein